MPTDHDGEYQVGYGRPPQHTRFQKGRSGNPKGRPSGSKNTSTLLQQELNHTVLVTENGKRKKITKRQAIVKQWVHKAASGDPRALKLLLDETRLTENTDKDGLPKIPLEVINALLDKGDAEEQERSRARELD